MPALWAGASREFGVYRSSLRTGLITVRDREIGRICKRVDQAHAHAIARETWG